MASGPNLIPVHRLRARQRRRRLRLWAGIATAYGLLLLGGYAACRGAWAGDGRAAAGALAEIAARADETVQSTRAAQRELATAGAALQAAREVREQPDWSILLVLLARSLNDDVVLRQCEVRPEAPAPGAAAPADNAPYLVRLAGQGRSQEAVSRLVSTLEQGGLFERVNLIKTRREPFLEGEAVAFQVECSLTGKAGGPK